jgi:hypothetical protein
MLTGEGREVAVSSDRGTKMYRNEEWQGKCFPSI